ncbi:MAG TPA: hypothetical protein VNX28_06490 [Gemmataceae bacterium]|jgi:hypothetical protein|nr:hypothetical protein [Gemmataceae bacterium]
MDWHRHFGLLLTDFFADSPFVVELEKDLSVFRLYAICSRFPQNLAQTVPWEAAGEGVYQCRRGTDVIHVVVAGQLARREHNAMLHLFSAAAHQRAYGIGHYRQRSPDTSTLINLLLQEYQREEIVMPYTMQDFRRDYAKEHFKDLTPEEKQEAIKGLTPEQRLKDLTPEQVLKSLTPEQVLKALTSEQRKRLREKLITERTSSQAKKRRRR